MPYKPCSLHNTTPSTLTQVNYSENITVVTYTLLTLLQIPINPPISTPPTIAITTTSTVIDSKSEAHSTKRAKKTNTTKKCHNSDLSSTTAINTALNKGQNYDRNSVIKSSISESEAMISYWVSNILGVRLLLTYYTYVFVCMFVYVHI